MTDNEKAEGLISALYRVEFYKRFFEKYKNNKLPRKELLLNMLEREYTIPRSDCNRCYELLVRNARDLGLLRDLKGTMYVRLGVVSLSPDTAGASDDGQGVPDIKEDASSAPQDSSGSVIADAGLPATIEPEETGVALSSLRKPTVFISHSKNTKILNQIKSNLEFGGFHYKVAIETETTAIPIPEKIFGMMRECDCAIVNVSADEQERREDGSYGINANVLVEIGAAFLTYNQRVILLVDERILLPSNLQGLYQCIYKGDELNSDAITKLQRGLGNFRSELD